MLLQRMRRGNCMVKPNKRMVKPIKVIPNGKPIKKEVWQRHHIRYEGENGYAEWVVWMRRKVHFEATRLQRYKNFTVNEKVALKYIIDNKPEIEKENAT